MKKLIIGCCILTTGINQAADTPVLPNPDMKKLELELKVGFSTARGNQESMRETLVLESNFGNNHRAAFFGIYEGYGADRGAHILASGDADRSMQPLHELTLHELIKQTETVQQEDKSIESASLTNAYRTMDANLKFLFGGHAIATALTALINQKNNMLYLAWAGSSGALLINSDGKIDYATKPHTFDNEKEIKRMAILDDDETKRGMDQLPKTPSGQILTRALGVPIERTTQGKSISTIPNPEIKEVDLRLNQKALILASDGLWDKIGKREAANYVLNQLEPSAASPRSNNNDSVRQAAEGLVKLAYQHGSIDNISVIVIEFVWKKSKQPSTTTQTEDVPRLSKALNTLLQQMPKDSQKKFRSLFTSIFPLLAEESPDYAAIRDKIKPHYLANQMNPAGGFQLLMAFEIFDNLSRNNHAAAEKLIKANKLLPE